jgi:hypothetical protein
MEWAEDKDNWGFIVNTVINSRENPVRKRALGRLMCR